MDPLAALREAIGDAAGPADGLPARFVARPASTVETAAVVRIAASHNLSIVVRGAGTKQDWGGTLSGADLVLDTTRICGVVEHAAGDLIAVVRAGTPLHDVQHLGDQQLALDGPIPGATVGGTVATNTSGPRRMAYGTVRDLIIGVTFVRADGAIAKAGGKVVKNVAGYDLAKLLTGSYGTLGVITECAFRLHPRPASTAVISGTPGSPSAVGQALRAIRDAHAVPTSVEVDAPAEGGFTVSVEISGVAAEARASALLSFVDGSLEPERAPWRYPWSAGDVGLKLTMPLSRIPGVLQAVLDIRSRYAVPLGVRGSIGTGVLYAGFPVVDAADAIVKDLRSVCESAVVLTAPPAIRDDLDLWGPVPGLDLMRRIKAQFDPAGRFASGRFVGGI